MLRWIIGAINLRNWLQEIMSDLMTFAAPLDVTYASYKQEVDQVHFFP